MIALLVLGIVAVIVSPYSSLYHFHYHIRILQAIGDKSRQVKTNQSINHPEGSSPASPFSNIQSNNIMATQTKRGDEIATLLSRYLTASLAAMPLIPQVVFRHASRIDTERRETRVSRMNWSHWFSPRESSPSRSNKSPMMDSINALGTREQVCLAPPLGRWLDHPSTVNAHMAQPLHLPPG
jgi:hypothetical protein